MEWESQTIEDFFANAWRWKCGLPEKQPRCKRPCHQRLQESQWNPDFEELMRNRLIMGAFRYATFDEQKTMRHDNPSSMRKHLDQYVDTGNGEHLVDIANLALVEFTLPSHQRFHFESIDDGEHTKPCVRY